MTKNLLMLLSCFALMAHDLARAEVSGIKDGQQMTREIAKKVRTISTEDLQRDIERNPDLVLIDIRMPGEIDNQGGSIKATQNVNIPRGWLEFRVTNHATRKNTPIVVYCGGGIRSPLAVHTLQQMGYTDVRDYSDGFLSWKQRGLPVE